MSHATLYVRFPDGCLRYGIYSGTADTARGALFDSPEQAWSAKDDDAVDWWPDGDGPVVPVEVATDYGGGCGWRGTAARNALADGFDPYESDGRSDGLPHWAVYPGVVVDGSRMVREIES